MKILLVEDDPTAAIVIESVLRALNREPVVVADADAALAELQRQPIRIIVSDWQMPGRDGLDLCREIRRRKDTYIYFILLTQMKSSDENQLAAMNAGVDDFLTKPVRISDMRIRLHVAERILGFTRHVRQLQGFLPICGYCRNVRDDRDYWSSIEDYISSQTDASVTHSVCPTCYQSQVVPQMRRWGIDPPPYPTTSTKPPGNSGQP